MDFAWVVDALRRGLKVTREAWKEFPQMYLQRPEGVLEIRLHTERGFVPWQPSYEELLDVTDWEEYVEPKKEPVFGNTKLSFDENGHPHMGDTITDQDSHGWKPVEELDIDAETNKAIALVARNIAVNLVELLQNPSVQRILQMRDVPLYKEGTNHV